MEDLGSRVAALKSQIARPEARQRGFDWHSRREVDSLIDAFYDDIGRIKLLPLKSLFDLFLIKVLYIDRGERDIAVLDYLSEMLQRFLFSRELMRFNARYDFLFSILEEMKERQKFQNLFEASRQLADNALFVVGVFPTSRPGRRRYGMSRGLRFDREHFVELGRRYYRVAAEEELAAVVGQREVLTKLSDYFHFYMETLSELSQRYILGFDMDVISNKMLDALNLYRRTGDPHYMESAQKYAALLRIDRRGPGPRRPRGLILGPRPV
jgi:hypothetical protein